MVVFLIKLVLERNAEDRDKIAGKQQAKARQNVLADQPPGRVAHSEGDGLYHRVNIQAS